MSAVVLGRVDWDLKRNDRGHRDYMVRWLIETSSVDDGPQVVMTAAGLPLMGAAWAFGNDNDPWAFCWPEMTVTPQTDAKGEPNCLWVAEQTFTTRMLTRCMTLSIENPLMEPPRISGSFVEQKREKQRDRNDVLLTTSAGEPYSGQLIEIDESHPTVNMEFTTLANQLAVFTPYMQKVNDRDLWGVGRRMIKLSGGNWQRKVWGTCTFYYVTSLEFRIHPRTWDRKLEDYGNWCLNPEMLKNYATQPVPNSVKDTWRKDPKTYCVQYKDRNQENAKCFLDGHGAALEAGNAPVYNQAEWYEETNFLALGISATL